MISSLSNRIDRILGASLFHVIGISKTPSEIEPHSRKANKRRQSFIFSPLFLMAKDEQAVKDELISTLMADPEPAEPVPSEEQEPAPQEEDAPGGDIASDEEQEQPEETPSDEPSSDEITDDLPEEEDDQEEAPPKSRIKDRFRELTSEKKQLLQQTQDLVEQNKVLIEQLAKSNKKEEAPAKPKVDLSKYDPNKLAEAKELLQSLGLGEVAAKVESLDRELKRRDAEIERDRDLKSRRETVERFKAVITEQEIETQIAAWEKDSDPRVQLRAQLPYEDIVILMKKNKIIEKEVNDVLKKKKTPAPKLSSPKPSLKKPEDKQVRLQPGNFSSSTEMLKRDILERIKAPAE